MSAGKAARPRSKHAPGAARALAAFAQSLSGAQVELELCAAIPRASSATGSAPGALRPSFAGTRLLVPESIGVASGGERAIHALSPSHWAATAHLAAHLAFTPARLPVRSLRPLQIAVISLFEDARIEHLACARYPGLRGLFRPLLESLAPAGEDAPALLARLSRALSDEALRDDNAWVGKAQRAFFEQRGAWSDPGLSRALGNVLANELGQMRVQFNAREYVVAVAYRDDNLGLWQAPDREEAESASAEAEPVRSVARQDGVGARASTPEPARPLETRTDEDDLHARSARKEATERERAPDATYGEWDYVIACQRPDWASVWEQPVERGDARDLEDRMIRHATPLARLRRQLAALGSTELRWLPRQLAGDALDIRACVSAVVARRTRSAVDPRVYARLRSRRAEVAVLVLLDLSASANQPLCPGSSSVLDVTREASALLCQAASARPGLVAIHGFCSSGRKQVQYYRFKGFEDGVDERCNARLAGMRAQLSTRLGAAMRHAGSALTAQKAPRKLLLVVSDGAPADIDIHDPEYLVLDAKQATAENRSRRIASYCLSLGGSSEASVERIFGRGRYRVVERAERLPGELLSLCARLAG